MPQKSFEVPVEPAVMKWARESAGRTIGDVAVRLGVSEDLVKSWESGKRKPTITRLRILTDYYQRPLDAFLLSAPPEESPTPKDFHFRSLPNKEASPLQADTLFALRKAKRLQSVAAELKGEFHNKLVDSIGKVTEASNPELLAVKVRGLIKIDHEAQSKWKKDSGALNQWIKAVGAFNILAIQVSMPLEDARAFCLINGGYPVIVLNTKEPPNARIFSLFHEVGHVLLDIEGICDPSGYPVFNERSRDIEIFCNHFAGAFLVPKNDLMEHSLVRENNTSAWSNRTLQTISRTFKVSKEVILRRLLLFDLTTESFYNEWKNRDEQSRQEMLKKQEERGGGGGRDIARECIQQNSAPIVSLILESYYNRRISKYDISDYLEINLKYLSNIERTLEV